MKVLIITYYWPPAGGPGVQRWLKFCSYLPDYGVEPVVYIPENPTYPITDEGLLEEVPQSIKILKHRIWEPYFLGRLLSKSSTKTISKGIIADDLSVVKKAMLYVRGNLFIPDARKAWVKPSVKFLKRQLEKQQYDAVITTGPPHSLHLIGMRLKKATGIRWIADFRDPWTSIGYHNQLSLTARSKRKHKDLEAQVLNSADEIIVTSPGTKTEFTAITDKPVTLITNGYDISNKPKTAVALDEKFSIAHIGSLLAKRNPDPFWKELERICMEVEGFKEDLKLLFAGVVAEEVKDSLKYREIYDCAEFKGYVNHAEAIKLQHQSQLLLLLEIDSPDTRAILPGKLYEYMMAGRPILAFGPEGSDIAPILKQTGSGEFFNYHNPLAFRHYIMDAYRAYKDGKLTSHQSNIEAYERRALTGRLADLLKKRNPRQD